MPSKHLVTLCLVQVKTIVLCFIHGSGASRSARALMASEEMVEEMEKALAQSLRHADDAQQYGE